MNRVWKENIACILYIRDFYAKELALHVLASSLWFSRAAATMASSPGWQVQQRLVLLLSPVCLMPPRRGRYVCPSICPSSSSLDNRSNLVLTSYTLAVSNSPGTQVYRWIFDGLALHIASLSINRFFAVGSIIFSGGFL